MNHEQKHKVKKDKMRKIKVQFFSLYLKFPSEKEKRNEQYDIIHVPD